MVIVYRYIYLRVWVNLVFSCEVIFLDFIKLYYELIFLFLKKDLLVDDRCLNKIDICFIF